MNAIKMMRNMFDYLFMESYLSRRSLLRIKCTIQNGLNSRDEETRKMAEEILNMIPNLVSFNIKNNIAISTDDYVDNNIPISKLMSCEGLNESHVVRINREQHLLIAKVNLYTSTSMF